MSYHKTFSIRHIFEIPFALLSVASFPFRLQNTVNEHKGGLISFSFNSSSEAVPDFTTE